MWQTHRLTHTNTDRGWNNDWEQTLPAALVICSIAATEMDVTLYSDQVISNNSLRLSAATMSSCFEWKSPDLVFFDYLWDEKFNQLKKAIINIVV